MPAMPNVYVLGCGGHAKVVVQTLLALGYGIAAIYDDDTSKCGSEVLGIPVAGPTCRIADHDGAPAVIAIGDNAARRALATRYKAEWLTIVHPRAYVDPTAQLGEGTVVFAGAVVQAASQVGSHVIVNTSASVDHDCRVGDFVHIAPGVRLAGGVEVGCCSFLGMGALVLPERRVGANAIIGAGAVVTRNLSDSVTAVGVPARVIKSDSENEGRIRARDGCRMVKSLRNILITSAGRRVSLLRFFREACAKLGGNSLVMAIDINPEWSSSARSADRAFSSPHVMGDEYGGFLADLVRREAVGLIVPMIDTELRVLSRMSAGLAERGCHVVVCEEELIAICRDKRQSTEWFQALGFEVPRILDRESLTFPCFVKPIGGSLSVGARALPSAADVAQSTLLDTSLMFLEYCDPVDYDEYTVDTYYDRNGMLKCLVPRKRVEVRGGEISKGIAFKGKTYQYLWDKLAKIPGARGCLTYQFFVSKAEDRWIASELNPRFGGGYPLSHAAGANFPEWIIREYLLGEEIPAYEDWQDRTAMVRYDSEIIFVATETP